MSAKPLRVIDLYPVESSFTDEEREAIKAEAKRLIAEGVPKVHSRTSGSESEDALTKWKREGEERQAREAAALAEIRGHEARQQRQQRMQAYVERRLAEEREFTSEVMAELMGEMLARIEKLEEKK